MNKTNKSDEYSRHVNCMSYLALNSILIVCNMTSFINLGIYVSQAIAIVYNLVIKIIIKDLKSVIIAKKPIHAKLKLEIYKIKSLVKIVL